MEVKKFDTINFTINPLSKGEYDTCSFTNSSFLNSDLSEIVFMECEFENCDLSMARLINTTLCEVKFRSCKLLGLRFDTCNEIGLSVAFDTCNLNHNSFYRMKLRKTLFLNSKLHEVDFTGCDLSSSVFDQCDFAGATFENTILEKADFRNSFNYLIDPERNRIKKAKFSLGGLPGLLHKYDIEIE
jgi:fluoroquinolone resistance protein